MRDIINESYATKLGIVLPHYYPTMPMGLLLAVVLLFVSGRLLLRRHRQSLPPGPKGWPLIGNLLDLPTSYEWEVYAKWGEKWGE